MARLQDFQTVTPSGSDKLLIVQSQGQGLATLDTVVGVKMDKASPTGTGALSINRKTSTTVGNNSVAVNYNTTASGTRSFASGESTTASGEDSFTSGYSTTASGITALATGYNTIASGLASFSSGSNTEASGSMSSAEGRGTKANHLSQHVFGEYNVADTSTAAVGSRGDYVEIVGKGTADNARSNARTLDWSGNEVLAGDLTINGNQSLSAILARIVNPPDLSNITSESLENGTVTAFTSTGKWYCVRTINTSTAGGCASYLMNNSEAYLSVGNAPQGTYVRATTMWLYFPSGFKFKARSIFATAGATGELLSASPLSI